MAGLRLCLSGVIFVMLASVSHAAVMLDRVVAVVNQEVITWGDLYRTMEEDSNPKTRELKEEEKRKIFRENESSYLEALINVRLQLQEAKGLGLSVTEEELKEAVENIKKKYAMSDTEFRESLKREGFTYEEYRRKLGEQILMTKVVTQRVRNKILVTEEQITKGYEANKGAIEASEGYKISQIFFKKPDSDEERSKLQEKAEAVLKKLKDGGSFSELARQYSEDPSGSNGGDLGVLRKDHLMKEFVDALAEMKPGDVSKPFWTESGLHIIKLDETKGPKDEKEMREEVRKMITEKIFQEKYAAWIKSLREKSFIEIRL